MRWIIVCIFIVYTVPVFGVDELTAAIYNWDDSPAGGGIQFPGISSLTTENPWIRSPQYIRVRYSSDRPIWGIRIVTDNENRLGQVYPKPINTGLDPHWEWVRLGLTGYQYVGGSWQTGDDSVSFGGLVDPVSKNNPNYRAQLAWQVFVDRVGAPDDIYRDWRRAWNVGGSATDDWAYIVDKSNKWNGTVSVVDSVFYRPWDPRYEMVVTGDPSVSSLAQHPVVSGSRDSPDPKPGDGDIAVYLAACFGIPNESGGFSSILPAGSYGGVIYLELLHE